MNIYVVQIMKPHNTAAGMTIEDRGMLLMQDIGKDLVRRKRSMTPR